jgi:hypothetical protein
MKQQTMQSIGLASEDLYAENLSRKPEPESKPEHHWGKISWVEWLLRKCFVCKEIGWWDEIKERFSRFHILRLPGGYRVFLHKLDSPVFHPKCHDHPWWFVTLILSSGYEEYTPEGTEGGEGKIRRRLPFSLLFRPAHFVHNVKTNGVSWSLILTGPKSREWKFDFCNRFLDHDQVQSK